VGKWQSRSQFPSIGHSVLVSTFRLACDTLKITSSLRRERGRINGDYSNYSPRRRRPGGLASSSQILRPRASRCSLMIAQHQPYRPQHPGKLQRRTRIPTEIGFSLQRPPITANTATQIRESSFMWNLDTSQKMFSAATISADIPKPGKRKAVWTVATEPSLRRHVLSAPSHAVGSPLKGLAKRVVWCGWVAAFSSEKRA